MTNRSIGIIALCLFLIAYGIGTISTIAFLPIVVGILAIVAGILILFGR